MKTFSFDSNYADLINKVSKNIIGADNLFSTMMQTAEAMTKAASTYPPYNIKKVEDNKYVIELAVAGFSKQDITLTLEDDKLADNVEIKNAEMINGLLKIWLEQIVPEHKKPKKIDINEPKKDAGPQLLTEKDL